MCVFCDIVSKKLKSYIVYENDKVIVFLDNDPINEGHGLLIPKNHYLDIDEIPDDVLNDIILVFKKLVNALKKVYKLDGYSIMQNGGKFNDIGHYHMHIFPRYFNDGFGFKYLGNVYECSSEIAKKISNILINNEL